MKIKNQIIYLTIRPNELFHRLSVNEWNELITSYENDPLAIVEEYNTEFDGYVFITTTLYNILKNHSLLDLRFNQGYRTEQHKTEYGKV